MARRRRRRYFKRIKPDMGWWTSQERVEFTYGTDPEGGRISFESIFSFSDIDSDDDLISQDKSDWFIKRVILDVYPVLGGISPGSAPARIYSLAMGTMQDSEAVGMSGIGEVLDPTTYERWRRLFKTYTRPVYRTWEPKLDSNGRLFTWDAMGSPVETNASDSPWGISSIHDDFSVSNAGLVDRTSLYLAISSDAIAPADRYEWIDGDRLVVAAYVRVLLQKRRT